MNFVNIGPDGRWSHFIFSFEKTTTCWLEQLKNSLGRAEDETGIGIRETYSKDTEVTSDLFLWNRT